MNKKRFFLLAVGIVALLMSCSESLKDDAQPIETQANLRVSAQDVNGNFLDAEATLRSTGQVLPIGASSPAVFKVSTGVHRVLVKKTGYADAQVQAVIDPRDNTAGNVHIAPDSYVNVKLYPTTANLTGSLRYTNANGKEVPAENVSVRITITEGSVVTNSYVDVTKAGGVYSFENLPAVGTAYYIELLANELPNGIIYNTGSISARYALLDGGTVDMGTDNVTTFGGNSSDFRVASYPRVIDISDTIVFIFSDKINKATIKNNTVNVPQVASIEWSDNTLTIIPASKWNPGTMIVTFNSLKSETGKEINGNYSITINSVDLSEATITNLVNTDSAAIQFGSKTANLQWDRIKVATGYRIYAAKKRTDQYVEVWSGSGTTVDDTVKALVNFGDYGLSVGKDSLFFRVLAYNAKSSTAMSAPKGITDRTPPDFLLGGYARDCFSIWSGTSYYWYSWSYDTDSNWEEDFYNCSPSWPNYAPSYSTNMSHTFTGTEVVNFYRAVPGSISSGHLTADEFAVNGEIDIATKLSQADAAVVTYGRIFFNEPMDITKTPTYTVVPATTVPDPEKRLEKKLIMEFKWNNDQNLEIALKTTTNNAIVAEASTSIPFNAIYSISGLFDKKGNAFAAAYGTSTTKRSTVDIRIKATVVEITPCSGALGSTACQNFCDTNPSHSACANKCAAYGNGHPTCCAANPNNSGCYSTTCSSPTTSTCRSFCLANLDNTSCANYWPCEMSNFGMYSEECKTTQCGGQISVGSWGSGNNPQSYCTQQSWTCDAFGWNSTACGNYCTNTNPAYDVCKYDENCDGGVTNTGSCVFGNLASAAKLAYCKALASSVSVYESLPNFCRTHYNKCEIYGENNLQCDDYCGTSTVFFIGESSCHGKPFCSIGTSNTAKDLLCVENSSGGACSDDLTTQDCLCDTGTNSNANLFGDCQ